MQEVRPPSTIVPELKPYTIDFTKYHNLCGQVYNFWFPQSCFSANLVCKILFNTFNTSFSKIDFEMNKAGQARPESARSQASPRVANQNVDLANIPGLARPPAMPGKDLNSDL